MVSFNIRQGAFVKRNSLSANFSVEPALNSRNSRYLEIIQIFSLFRSTKVDIVGWCIEIDSSECKFQSASVESEFQKARSSNRNCVLFKRNVKNFDALIANRILLPRESCQIWWKMNETIRRKLFPFQFPARFRQGLSAWCRQSDELDEAGNLAIFFPNRFHHRIGCCVDAGPRWRML